MVTEFIAHYAKLVATYPDKVDVKIDIKDDEANITLYAHQDDIGKLIGKQGKMIGAIKTVISGCKAKDGLSYKINVESV